jgi:hypothetical protein
MASVQVMALRRPTEDEMEAWEGFPSRGEQLLPAGTAQTDDRGQYRIFGIRAGEYYIKAVDQFEPIFQTGSEWVMHEALGSRYAPVYYPGVPQIGQAETVPLSSGQEAQADPAMRRIRTVNISDRVIGVDGKPADVYVYLEELPTEDYGINHGGATDAKGEFQIKGVAPGSYLLHAQQRSTGETNYHASQRSRSAATTSIPSRWQWGVASVSRGEFNSPAPAQPDSSGCLFSCSRTMIRVRVRGHE